MADKHRLVMTQGPRPGQTFALDKETIVLGRDPRNDITISHPQVSRKHARITRQGEFIVIEDLESTNGTLIDGKPLAGPHTLAYGETIGLGEAVTLTYYEPEAATVEAAIERRAAPAPRRPQDVQEPSYAGHPSPPATSRPPSPAVTAKARQDDLTRWLWVGVGCLALLLAVACVAVFVLDYLRLLPSVFYEPLRWLGLI